MNRVHLWIVAVCLIALTAIPAGAQIYVDHSATGADDGTSWLDAFTSLKSALLSAAAGDEIWVAAGTYQPTGGTNRAVTFDLKSDVAVYGGFAGTETLLDERDFEVYVTILSGDLGVPGDSLDNSYHVVTANGLNAGAILDGFTITRGYANTANERGGGGIEINWGSPVLRNLIVEHNYAGMKIGGTFYHGLGGGLQNYYGNPVLENVQFRNNIAHLLNARGGGMYTYDGAPRLTEVTFLNNEGYNGGGMYATGGTADIDQCSFEANIAGYVGSGLYLELPTSQHSEITNSTFLNNDGYGALYCPGNGELTITGSSFNNTVNGPGIGINGSLTINADSCTVANNSRGGIRSLNSGTVVVSNSSFSGNTSDWNGGAISTRYAIIDNCDFTGNTTEFSGGAIQSVGASISGSSFKSNIAAIEGGAVSVVGTISNSVFEGNFAAGRGGAINASYGSLTLMNIICVNNSAPEGGAVQVLGTTSKPSAATIVNSTITGNDADDPGSGIFVDTGATLHLYNSIVWNNGHPDSAQIDNNGTSTISHSLVGNSGGSGAGWDPSIGADAGGNRDADPLFGGPPSELLRLSWSSPCVNTGSNSAPGLPATDFAGDPRVSDGVVDMGVYEFVCPSGPVIYVNADATGAGDGNSWADAYTELRIGSSVGCAGVAEVWVAEGTYTVSASNQRETTIQLSNGLALYGGFEGTESSRSQRRPGLHQTVINGNNGTTSCYHVVTGTGTDSTAILDGFIVEGGAAVGAFPDDRGAGMINFPGSTTVTGVIFRDNLPGQRGIRWKHVRHDVRRRDVQPPCRRDDCQRHLRQQLRLQLRRRHIQQRRHRHYHQHDCLGKFTCHRPGVQLQRFTAGESLAHRGLRRQRRRVESGDRHRRRRQPRRRPTLRGRGRRQREADRFVPRHRHRRQQRTRTAGDGHRRIRPHHGHHRRHGGVRIFHRRRRR